MKMRLLIVGALVLSIAACDEAMQPGAAPGVGAPPIAAVAVTVPGTVVPRNKAQIYLFREKAFAGSANTYRISINGQPVADMAVATKVAHLVGPGPVTVSAETLPNLLNFGFAFAMMERPSMTLAAQGGATYAIKVSTGFAGGPVLTLVSDPGAIGQSTVFETAAAVR